MKKKPVRIALLGIDGSGKSTHLNRMKSDSVFADFDFIWLRYSPKLLKPLYSLLKKKEKKNGVSGDLKKEYKGRTDKKKKIFKNPFIRFLWRNLTLIDYFFQVRIRTFKTRLKKKNVIFDRYYPDLFIDLGANFGYPPEKTVKYIKRKRKLFPKADGYVYIRALPETCIARKDDIPSLKYLEDRFAVYEILKSDENFYTVDGEKTADEVYENVVSVIREKFLCGETASDDK